VLGAYASTYRRSTSVLRENRDNNDNDKVDRENAKRESGNWVQVQRLANPLVNEVIIGTEHKDRWNALDPSRERRFVDYYTNPRLVTALEAVFGADAEPLFDLRDVFLTYTPGEYKQLSELLRLDISVEPVALAEQNPLTALGSPADAAGWPNGRRPIDDVTDVAIRVVGGANYLTAGDGVNANDLPLPDTFPFLSTPWDGRHRIHQNPDGAPTTPTLVVTPTGSVTVTATGTLGVTATTTATMSPTLGVTATSSSTTTPTTGVTATATPSATMLPPSATGTSTATATSTATPTP
jgi:hypothetical protein